MYYNNDNIEYACDVEYEYINDDALCRNNINMLYVLIKFE